MANVDAIAAITLGGTDWDDYVKSVSGQIDLTFADLNGRDLSGLPLERCDFSGAQLSGANLDRTRIKECGFTGANLSQASLVDSEFTDVTAANLIAVGVVVRKSIWTRVRLENSQLEGAQFDDCDLHACHLSGVTGASLALSNFRQLGGSIRKLEIGRASIQAARWRDCDLEDWTIAHVQMTASAIQGGCVRGMKFSEGNFTQTEFANLRVERLDVDPTNVVTNNLDFSQSTLVHVALIGIGLESATMLDTALVACVWPDQRGGIDGLGKYVPSPHLLRQPVQDLRGVPPVTRREIADAQYIYRLQEKTSNRMDRAGLAIWGLTTGFGQSLVRLSVTTLCFLLLGTVLLLAARGQLVGPDFIPGLFYNAWSDAFAGFFALTGTDSSPTRAEGAVSGFNRILGFVALGLWVSIGANRLGKLGAE